MATHNRRRPELLDLAADDPGEVVPGAASAVILARDQADLLRKITFTRKPTNRPHERWG